MSLNPSATEYTPGSESTERVFSRPPSYFPSYYAIPHDESNYGSHYSSGQTVPDFSGYPMRPQDDPYFYSENNSFHHPVCPPTAPWGNYSFYDPSAAPAYSLSHSFLPTAVNKRVPQLSPALQLAKKKLQQEEKESHHGLPSSSCTSSSSFFDSSPIVSTAEANVTPSLPPTPEKPLVLLFLGCRGAGKSSLSKLAAEKYNLLHLSSGEMSNEGNEPYVELRRIVVEEFGANGKKRYAGLSLDRFIALSEIDAYYLQDALSVADLPVPFVVWLKVDMNVGLQRAALRGDQKQSSLACRHEEQRIQRIVAEKFFQPIGSLLTIDANHIPLDEVFKQVCSRIDFSVCGRHAAQLSSLPLLTTDQSSLFSGELVTDFALFKSLCREIHTAVGNITNRIEAAPMSSMASYIDKSSFSSSAFNKDSHLSSSYVTEKIDGQRYLLLKHTKKGFFAFEHKFTHCFSVDKHFNGIQIYPSAPNSYQNKLKRQSSVVDFILDTEFCSQNGRGVFFIIDFIFLYSEKGTKMCFAQRYDLLRKVFKEYVNKNNVPIALKLYVPINKLKELLPSLTNTSHPIDGVVFQHGDVYRFGTDKLLSKWKPKEQCTADFRVANKRKDGCGGWLFDILVTEYRNGSRSEEAYEGAVLSCSEEEIIEHCLENESIAELYPLEHSSDGKSVWKLRKARPDKQFPNKIAVVNDIVNMEHIDYDTLLEKTSAIDFQPLPPSFYPKFVHK